jgi:hypothetical protein
MYFICEPIPRVHKSYPFRTNLLGIQFLYINLVAAEHQRPDPSGIIKDDEPNATTYEWFYRTHRVNQDN